MFPKLYMYGSAECDQYEMPSGAFISRLPIEIPFSLTNQIRKIVCGGLHTLALTSQGQVFSWGCNDDGALGRTGQESVPGLISLECAVDMISCGDSHSLAANSKNGVIYQWGVYRNTTGGNMGESNRKPIRWGRDEFHMKSVEKLLSGANHSLVLAVSQEKFGSHDKKIYAWGDPDTGVLGRMPLSRRKFAQSLVIESIRVKGVEDVFTGNYHAFLKRTKISKSKGEKTQKSQILAWGLNNYGQLGIGTTENTYMPKEVEGLDGLDVKDVRGGEHFTLVLTKEGHVYGFGRNDDHQLGVEISSEEKENEGVFTFISKPKKIENLERISQIFCGPTYAYAHSKEDKQLYSWGNGDHYLLANGKEEEETSPFKIKPTFTKEGNILEYSLGGQHAAFLLGDSFPEFQIDISIIDEELKKKLKKSKRAASRSHSRSQSESKTKPKQEDKIEEEEEEKETILEEKKKEKEEKRDVEYFLKKSEDGDKRQEAEKVEEENGKIKDGEKTPEVNPKKRKMQHEVNEESLKKMKE